MSPFVAEREKAKNLSASVCIENSGKTGEEPISSGRHVSWGRMEWRAGRKFPLYTLILFGV